MLALLSYSLLHLPLHIPDPIINSALQISSRRPSISQNMKTNDEVDEFHLADLFVDVDDVVVV